MSPTQKASFTLTKEEQQLVEENHNLIYAFLRRYNYSIEEFYDVAAIGLCYAAHSYQLDKGAFSTYAFHTMKLRVSRAYQLQTSISHIPETLLSSLDEPIESAESGTLTLISQIEDPSNLEEEVLEKITYETFYNKQTPKTQKFLTMFQQGYNGREVAQACGCTQAWPESIRRELRTKYKTLYCNR